MNANVLKFVLVLIITAVASINVWGSEKTSSCDGFTQLEMNACAKESLIAQIAN